MQGELHEPQVPQALLTPSPRHTKHPLGYARRRGVLHYGSLQMLCSGVLFLRDGYKDSLEEVPYLLD